MDVGDGSEQPVMEGRIEEITTDSLCVPGSHPGTFGPVWLHHTHKLV